jgi:tyrosine-protein kinase Etk/Wzc
MVQPMTAQGSTTMESGVTPESVCSPAASSQGLEAIDVLTQLAYRKWLIAKVTGIAILAGLILSLLLPVRYTATTKLMPPQQTQSSASMLMNQLASGGAGSLAAMTGGGLGLKNPNDIYLGLLNSRPIADAIIQRFGLARVYHTKDMTAARKELAKRTEVTSEKSGFISVSVTDKGKQRAAQMANAYTDELRTLSKTLAVTEASQRRLFYEEQLKQAKEALVSAELAFQQVQQSKGLVQLDAQAKAMIEGLSELHAQVAAKQVEVQALRSYSTENNPAVQLAERKLLTLQAEADHLGQSNHGVGFSDMGLADVPGAGLEYLRADHELRYRQALMDMLMKQYDAARLDEAKDAAIVQVVEPAIEPDRKSSPKRALIVVLFTLAGLLIACSIALALWWTELLQFDPAAAKRFAEFDRALTGRKGASSYSLIKL